VIGSMCSGDGLRTNARIVLPRVIGLAFLLGVYAIPSMADSGCALNEVASLPGYFGGGGVAIDAGVNGQNAKFGLSTGSSATTVSEALVKRLGLPAVDMHMRTVSRAGTQERMNALVQDFTIGTMVSHANRFIVLDSGGDGTNGDVVGSLGVDYLGNYDIELDPAERKVNLFQPIQCGRAAYWWDDHFELPFTLSQYNEPVVAITLDGRTYRAIVDIASAHSTIDIAEAHRNLNVPDSIQPAPSGTLQLYTFKELIFGPITFRNPKVGLVRYKALALDTGSHIKEAASKDAPIIIGMDVLGKFHSMISFGSGKIYFTLPNERKPAQASAPKS
jgi:hypothetical protein